MSGLGCSEVETLAAELALGLVSATERASSLAHLRHCQTCQRLIDELSTVADGVLLLAPEAEPSIGFESRVLAATGTPERPQRRPARKRFRVAMAAAAALVAASTAVIGALALNDEGTKPDPIRTALAANGKATCRVFAFGERQAWVFVHLETPRDWTADYTVQVTTADQSEPQTLGELRLQAGVATLGATVDVPAERLRSIRVLKMSGELWYEAVFRT